VSRTFGLDRGLPVDRWYIEAFLARNAGDIRGRVLEVGSDVYTRRFGGDRVERADVLHATPGHPGATFVADLADSDGLPTGAFDAVVVTQTLQFVYDVRAAVATLHRILGIGGIALVTVPGISQISRYDAERWGDYWRFTTQSAERLFGSAFESGSLDVETFGNLVGATALLHGLAVEDLDPVDLDPRDPDYEVIVAVRAVKR
jgi:SAM-dependent methyltransferase